MDHMEQESAAAARKCHEILTTLQACIARNSPEIFLNSAQNELQSALRASDEALKIYSGSQVGRPCRCSDH